MRKQEQERANDTERPVDYRDLPVWMRSWVLLAFALLAGCVLIFAYIGITADPPDDDDDPSISSSHIIHAHAVAVAERRADVAMCMYMCDA